MPDSIPLKPCSKCGVAFPHTGEFFHKDKNTKSGLRSDCKECHRASKRHYRNTNLEKCRARENRYDANNRDKRRRYNRIYYAINIERLHLYDKSEPRRTRRNETNRAWRKANPAQVKIYRQRDQERNRVAINARAKRWREANPDKERIRQRNTYLRNRDKILERTRKYLQDHPEKQRVHAQRRRTRSLQLPHSFTAIQWLRALAYFDNCCAVCGRPLEADIVLAQDHWIPVSYASNDNPGYVVTNIVPLCHGMNGCNNSKSDKLPHIWLVQIYGEEHAAEILARIQAYFVWASDQID